MGNFLNQSEWDAYADIMEGWNADVGQQKIIWKSALNLSKNGEDNNWNRFNNMELEGLVHYNYFRSWPMSQSTDSGEIDKENCMIYFNLDYMKKLNLLTSEDQFMFDPGQDRFVINGVLYKAMGDSQVGQAGNRPLWVFIICKREETETGQKIYNNG